MVYSRIRVNSDKIEFRDNDQQTYRDLDSLVKGENITTKIDDLGAADDNTDLDATSSAHGLMPKLDKIAFADGWIPSGETWTYAASDDPTYTFTIASFDATSKYSAGMRVKLTDSGTQYFIITKVVFDDPGSTITVYGGTDYDLSGGAITNPYYSMMKAPLNFPIEPSIWSHALTSTSDRTTNSPAQNTWYNAESLVIPQGIWMVKVMCCIAGYDTSATAIDIEVTLSTANNSESDANWTMYRSLEAPSGTLQSKLVFYREKQIDLSSAKDTYYLNYRTTLSGMAQIQILGGLSTTYIIAQSVYL